MKIKFWLRLAAPVSLVIVLLNEQTPQVMWILASVTIMKSHAVYLSPKILLLESSSAHVWLAASCKCFLLIGARVTYI